MKFIKAIGLSTLMALGLAACSDSSDEVIVQADQKVVVVERVVVQQPVFLPPVRVQRYSMLDVEQDYHECLVDYGVGQYRYCKAVCDIEFNREDCGEVQDYYEDRYRVGYNNYDHDAFIVYTPYYQGTSYKSNRKYGKAVTVTSPLLKSPPRRKSFVNKGKINSPVSTYSKVTTPTVKKIGSDGIVKQGNQFTAKKVSDSKTVTVTKNARNGTPNTVTKIGTGNVVKKGNQFTAKKPSDQSNYTETIDSRTVNAIGVASAGAIGAVTIAKVSTPKVTKIGSGKVIKKSNQFTQIKPKVNNAAKFAKEKAQRQAKAKAEQRKKDERKRQEAKKREQKRQADARKAEKRRKDEARKRAQSKKKP